MPDFNLKSVGDKEYGAPKNPMTIYLVWKKEGPDRLKVIHGVWRRKDLAAADVLSIVAAGHWATTQIITVNDLEQIR